MKRNLPIPAAALLLALTMGAAANILPAGKDTEDIMVGVTGMTVALKGGKLLVTQVTPDTPAEGSSKRTTCCSRWMALHSRSRTRGIRSGSRSTRRRAATAR